jgi:hypothetical protein
VGEDATPPREVGPGDDSSTEDFEGSSPDTGFLVDSGDDGSSEDDGSFEDGFDASDASDAEVDTGVSCLASPGTITVTSSGCAITLMETCGDTAYHVSCSCPKATCTCTQMTSSS